MAYFKKKIKKKEKYGFTKGGAVKMAKKKDYERSIIVDNKTGHIQYLPKYRRNRKNPKKAFQNYLKKLSNIGLLK